jgi:predicted metal-dependent hydrolase
LKSSIEYDGERISFEVQQADRKTMEISVHPDGRVVVKAPTGTPQDVVDRRVLRRARWIREKLEYFLKFKPRIPPRRYVGGETHLFLGRQYRLKLITSPENGVKLKGGYFLVSTRNPGRPEEVKNLLDTWYSRHATLLFRKRLHIYCDAIRPLKEPFPSMKVRRMRRRWGSCSDRGTIVLNKALIEAPLFCIDYVIMHELCHLKVPGHGPKFWALLQRRMPDYAERRRRLEICATMTLA